MKADAPGGHAAAVAAMCLVAFFGLGREALSQGTEPIVVSPRQQLEWFHLDDISLALDLRFRHLEDRVKPDSGRTVRDVQNEFREIIELGTSGYVGHPNLLTLNLAGSLWFTQNLVDFDSSSFDGTLNDFLWEYDLSGTFLQKRKMPVTVYSRRVQSELDRQFGGTLDNTVTRTGVRANVRDDVFPTDVEFYYQKQEQDDVFGATDLDIERYTVEANGRVVLGLNQEMWWDMSYDDVDERGTGVAVRSFERIEANATHTLNMGDNQEHQLRSAIRFFDEESLVDFRNFRIFERLRLRPNQSLMAWFDYSYDDQKRGPTEQRQNRATANVRHELFDSLVTTGLVGGSALRIDPGDFYSDEFFGDLVLDYTKEVPLGVLTAGVGISGNRNWRSDQGVDVPIVDRVFTFNAADRITIQGRNIIESSIVITDLTGLFLYTENVDYTVLGLPDRVEITRIAGGAIAPLQTVLIDYIIGPEPGGRITTQSYALSAQYTFDEGILAGLSPYVRYLEQDEDRPIETVSADFPENDFSNLVFGVEYNAWKLYVKAERQHRRGSLSPFNLTYVEGRYTEPLGRNTAFTMTALFQEIDRRDVDIRTTVMTFSGQLSFQLANRLNGNLLVLYRDTDDNTGGDSDAWQQELFMTWRYRQTEVYARIRNNFRNDPFDETSFQRFEIGLRREF
jgi:hypothetical protein